MKLKWKNGRQSYCTYKKICFLFKKINRWGFDGYILKYAPYTILPAHIDTIENGKHWRLNITLYGKGYFRCKKMILNLWKGRVIFFRPDINEHMMVNGFKTRYVLSLGFAIYKKKKYA